MDRVILGKSPEVDSGETSSTYYRAGNTGLFISKPGANVLSCSDGDLLFDTTADDFFQVLAKGNASLPPGYMAWSEDPRSTGFTPSTTKIETNVLVPHLEENATLLVRWNILTSSSNLHSTAFSSNWNTLTGDDNSVVLPISLASYNFNNLDGPFNTRKLPITARTVGKSSFYAVKNDTIAYQGGVIDANDGKLVNFSGVTFHHEDPTKVAFIANENSPTSPGNAKSIYIGTFDVSTKLISNVTRIVDGTLEPANIIHQAESSRGALEWARPATSSSTPDRLIYVRKDATTGISHIWTVIDPAGEFTFSGGEFAGQTGPVLNQVTGRWNESGEGNENSIENGLDAINIQSARFGVRDSQGLQLYFNTDEYPSSFVENGVVEKCYIAKMHWRTPGSNQSAPYDEVHTVGNGEGDGHGDSTRMSAYSLEEENFGMWVQAPWNNKYFCVFEDLPYQGGINKAKKVMFISYGTENFGVLSIRNRVDTGIIHQQELIGHDDNTFDDKPSLGEITDIQTISRPVRGLITGIALPLGAADGSTYPKFYILNEFGGSLASLTVKIIDLENRYLSNILYNGAEVALDGQAPTFYFADQHLALSSPTGSHIMFSPEHGDSTRTHWIQAADIVSEQSETVDIIFENINDQSFNIAWTLYKAKGTI